MITDSATARALVIDDSTENRQLFAFVLSRAGYEVVEAESGSKGLTLLDHDPDFHVLVLDLLMPGITGVEVLHRLRADPRYEGLYIIVATGNSHMAASEGLVVSADFVVYKPVDVDKFIKLVERLRAAPR